MNNEPETETRTVTFGIAGIKEVGDNILIGRPPAILTSDEGKQFIDLNPTIVPKELLSRILLDAVQHGFTVDFIGHVRAE